LLILVTTPYFDYRIIDRLSIRFSESAPGIAGLETLLSLTLKLVDEKSISLSNALARITNQPAQILGIDVGHLTPGAPADICIFDPEATWQVDPRYLKSQGSNTPFDGTLLSGAVGVVLIAGCIRLNLTLPT